MIRAARLASKGLRPMTASRKAAPSHEGAPVHNGAPSRRRPRWRSHATIGILLGVCACLTLVTDGWALSEITRPLKVGRITIQAENAAQQGLLGEVLLSITADGKLELIGLQKAVPTSSTVTLYSDPLRTIAVGTPSTMTATALGGFPGVGEATRIVIEPTGFIGAIYIRANSPQQGVINGRIPFEISNGQLNSSAMVDAAVRKVPIVATGNEGLVGEVLLTQRVVNGQILDYIQGLPGAFPALSTVKVSYQTFLPNPDRIGIVSIGTLSTAFIQVGGSQFVSNGCLPAFAIGDQNSANITKAGLGTIDAQIRFEITQQNGSSFNATVQNDVVAEFSVNPVVDGANNNNVANPSTTAFPFPTSLGQLTGSVGGNEAVGGFVNYYVSGNASEAVNIGTGGTFTLPITTFGSLEFPLGTSAAPLRLHFTDSFGNTTNTDVVVDSVSNLYETRSTSTTRTGLVGTLRGKAEPGAAILVSATIFSGVEQAETYIGRVNANTSGDVGAFRLDITSSPFVIVRAVDRAGNVSAPQTVTIDAVAQNPTITGSLTSEFLADGSIEYRFSGTAEKDATIEIFGAAVDFTPLAGVATNDTFDSLPYGSREVGLRGTVSTAAGANTFSVAIKGVPNEALMLRTVDLAGNRSQYKAVVLNLFPTNIGITADVTNFARGIFDRVKVTVTNTKTNTPIDGLFVNLFDTIDPGVSVGRPISEVNFWTTGMDAPGIVNVDIPEYFQDSTDTTGANFVQSGVVMINNAAGATLGVVNMTGLDRTGPTIGFTIFPDLDFQVVERGSAAGDILNILNVLPSTYGAPTSVPADAMPLVAVLADGNADGVIDVNDASIIRIALTPFNDLIYNYGFTVPGVDNISLGNNFWDAASQTVRGYEEVFVVLFDQYFNYATDPIPIQLDVRIDDPNTDSIRITSKSVVGSAGAVEANCYVSLYANASLTDFLGTAQADDSGSFAISFNRTDADELFLQAIDRAGNRTNAVNLKQIKTGLSYTIADGYGLLHAPGKLYSALPRSTDLVKAMAPAPGANGAFYLVDGNGAISSYRVIPPESGSPVNLPTFKSLSLTNNLARDIEIAPVGTSLGGYVLGGQGFVFRLGNAPYFGDIADTQGTASRVTLDNGQILLDTNGNGTVDLLLNEDANGNGVLDVTRVVDCPTCPGGYQILPGEDTNGNNKLDIVYESVFNPDTYGIGFGFDAARDLEVVYDNTDAVAGYVMLDSFGTLHNFGATKASPLVNLRVDFGFGYKAMQLVTDADNNVVDFIAMTGTGLFVGTPGGPLGAAPSVDDQGNPRGDEGDLSVALNINLPYFGFDILRDVQANPIDSDGNGLTGDGSDGFYVLDGFGGIYAIGGAPEITGAPFLGFDIARDLDFTITQ